MTPVVKALQALRGLALVAAATLVAELSDITRIFANPQQFMAYLGLVPSEHSSGSTRRQGGIPKAGNGAARRMLIEAACRLPVSSTYRSRSPSAPRKVEQANPRHSLEGPGATLPSISQARPCGEIEDRDHRRDCARAFGLRLGDRETDATQNHEGVEAEVEGLRRGGYRPQVIQS